MLQMSGHLGSDSARKIVPIMRQKCYGMLYTGPGLRHPRDNRNLLSIIVVEQ